VQERRKPTLGRAARNRLRPKKVAHQVQALDDVTFSVAEGSVVGVIGHNGSGKSTLLRCIAGILHPTEGRITVWGRVSPLLSLGLGFNRELTGRENILLGGLSLGLDAEYIREQYTRIVAFAALGEALDMPMRTYSSGMFGRLGFAIAAHLDPEIMLIDEALSAGDARFRDKTTQKITELCEGNTTVMIVSHGLSIVKSLASRCIWLDHGRVVAHGPADEVVDAYLTSQDVSTDSLPALEDF
jgi:ABC-type polysaccharide/polyol phosphate transport system ATPase subunit